MQPMLVYVQLHNNQEQKQKLQRSNRLRTSRDRTRLQQTGPCEEMGGEVFLHETTAFTQWPHVLVHSRY